MGILIFGSGWLEGFGIVVAIEVHHFGPGCDEVVHECLLRVAGCVDFCECSELGVGSEDQIDYGASPFGFTGGAVEAFEYA